jgi:KUP system potassium uptake protein
MNTHSHANERNWVTALAVPALGVVFGDIGTSPLYTLRECLNAAGGATVEPVVLGLLSLIFWTIVFVVSLKYVVFIMRADNQGEGGIMALLALSLRSEQFGRKGRKGLIAVGLIGAALFYGDGIITPAISVLSAVEGLELATPRVEPYVIPIALGVLIGLFLIQRHGTTGVGRFFGPVMLIWFLTLGGMGLLKILDYPAVLKAINPLSAVYFLMEQTSRSLPILGAVVLSVTGAEALYADMGHFGARPIRASWFWLVFPALALNYLGQGATELQTHDAIRNPFFLMFPEWALIPIVILATVATVIASQAVISGAYSITQQAFHLGYLPRVRIHHTSETERGQIYLPGLNTLLLLAIIVLVLSFGSSSKLASAYGIAVTGTMMMTTLLFYVVARHAWKWRLIAVIPLVLLFLLIDAGFLGANLMKFLEGGWLPVLLGLVVFTIMSTWLKGRTIIYKRLYPQKGNLKDFLAQTLAQITSRVAGTAVYLAAPGEGVPNGLLQNVRHNKVLHEKVIILSIAMTDRPREEDRGRHDVDNLGPGIFQLTARFGFMELPDIPKLLATCAKRKLLDYDTEDISYFVSRLKPVPTARPGMALWREKLFVLMLRNAAQAPDLFRIPSVQVVELHMKLEI